MIGVLRLYKKERGKYDDYFPNYLFTICIFSIAKENEEFNWQWINDRCNPELSIKDANRNAPSSWKKWIEQGISKIHTIRRKVLSGKVIPDNLQRPEPKSDLDVLLKSIYSYYTGHKSDFEALAMEVTRLVIEDNGGRCSTGWLTLASGDGGYDFVLKTTLGTNDLARLQIIMLGQAKCEKLTGHVNGKDIARLVAQKELPFPLQLERGVTMLRRTESFKRLNYITDLSYHSLK